MQGTELDRLYMRRCLQLAANGRLTTAPNPMVGAVVVADGRIIGEGWHQRYGEAHAEVNAIRRAEAYLSTHRLTDSQTHCWEAATLYVNLEPCCHYGKTPPCADLIVEKGIRKVVVGAGDPNSKVNGGGIRKLREAGVEVVVGVLEDECRELNKVFYCNHEKQRPYITLKWAQTRVMDCGSWVMGYRDSRLIISNAYTNILCHKRRAENGTILVGRKTWEEDKPQLNVRYWAGRDPEKVVLSGVRKGSSRGVEVAQGVQGSVLVEGGRETLQSFIDQGLWDEAFVEASCARREQVAGSREQVAGSRELLRQAQEPGAGDCVVAPKMDERYWVGSETMREGHVMMHYKKK